MVARRSGIPEAPAGAAEKPQSSKEFRSVYNDILSQPAPDRFLDLLKSLDGIEGSQPLVAKANEVDDAWSKINAGLQRINQNLSEFVENNVWRLARIGAAGDRIERESEQNHHCLGLMVSAPDD